MEWPCHLHYLLFIMLLDIQESLWITSKNRSCIESFYYINKKGIQVCEGYKIPSSIFSTKLYYSFNQWTTYIIIIHHEFSRHRVRFFSTLQCIELGYFYSDIEQKLLNIEWPIKTRFVICLSDWQFLWVFYCYFGHLLIDICYQYFYVDMIQYNKSHHTGGKYVLATCPLASHHMNKHQGETSYTVTN